MLSLLKNNWKKVTFLTSVSGFGLYSFQSYIEESSHMRKLCNAVMLNRSNDNSPKQLLVILNPAANKKKTEKLFKKYCEPILHLAGFSITILKTNHVGHAKAFVESLKQLPDVIAVAGGQGTSSEVVTGLLRRTDVPCPILFLPLGSKEKFEISNISSIFKSNFEYITAITKSATALVQNEPHFEKVIRYDVIDAENDVKPIFGLHRFSWGLIKDINSIKDKYWYFGSLRYYAAIFFNAFSSDLNSEFGTDFAFTPPCPGCKNCVLDNKSNKNESIIKRLVSPKLKDNTSNKYNAFNENCTKKMQGHIKSSQLDIDCKKNTEKYYELEAKFSENILLGVDLLKKSQNIVNDKLEHTLLLNSRTLELYPSEPTESNSCYTIDGEEYAVRPIKVSVVQNAIRVFN